MAEDWYQSALGDSDFSPLRDSKLGRTFAFQITGRPMKRQDPMPAPWSSHAVSHPSSYKRWKAQVRGLVEAKMAALKWTTLPRDVPVFVWCEARYHPPQKLLKHNRFRVTLPTSRAVGDVDKVARAVGDAICTWTKTYKRKAGEFKETRPGVIEDDAQIVGWVASKIYIPPDKAEQTSVTVAEVIL